MAGQNNGKQGGQQQDVNQLLKVRREKLANLQEAGQDPFQITKYDVTHHTSDVKDLYNAHEEKLLAGRPAVNTDGMDEAAAREAVKADYEERRSIMDADPIHVSIAGRMMFKRVMGKASFANIQDLKETSRSMLRVTQSEKICTQLSRNPTSVISGVSRDMHSAQRQEKSLSMRRR